MSNRILIKILFISLLSFISCEREVYNSEPEELPVKNVSIYIDSKPAGALIYVNYKNTGLKTPAKLNWLEEGFNKFTLKLNLFKDTTIYFFLNPDEVDSVLVNYYLNPGHYGKVYCTSFPSGADIYLNDSLLNLKTPATVYNLFPGLYKIKYTKRLHRADSNNILIKGSILSFFHLSLEDTSVWVSYRTNNSGINSNLLADIVVDSNNIKWIGTRDKGLCKFDGKNWSYFNNENSPLLNNNINDLAIDRFNRLWIATATGLQVYNGINWIDYTSYLPDNYVTSIAFDKNGNTWIGTQNGLVKYNGSNWVIYNTKNGVPGNFITAIAIDEDNKIWIGTSTNGIGIFNGISWTHYNMNNMGLPINVGNIIKEIKCDRRGNVYVAHAPSKNNGYTGGFTKFNGSFWEVLTLNVISSHLIETIYVDKNDMIWVGTKDGLTKFYDNPGNAIFYNTYNSQIPGKEVSGIVIDKNDDLWVTTFGGGLGKLKKGNF